MVEWVLVVYLSFGFGTASHAGFSMLPGFNSKEDCITFERSLESRFGNRKIDQAYCIPRNKPE